MSDEQNTLTTKETAKLLGVTRPALYKMMDKGDLTPLPQDTDAQFPPLKFDRKSVEELKRKRDKTVKPRRSRTPKAQTEPHQAA